MEIWAEGCRFEALVWPRPEHSLPYFSGRLHPVSGMGELIAQSDLRSGADGFPLR